MPKILLLSLNVTADVKKILLYSNFCMKNYSKICCLLEFFIGSGYKDHVHMMAPAVQELAALERQAQIMFLKSHVVKGN